MVSVQCAVQTQPLTVIPCEVRLYILAEGREDPFWKLSEQQTFLTPPSIRCFLSFCLSVSVRLGVRWVALHRVGLDCRVAVAKEILELLQQYGLSFYLPTIVHYTVIFAHVSVLAPMRFSVY